MGANSSLSSIYPKYILGDADESIIALACNDTSVLVLKSDKTVSILGYEGQTFTRKLNMQPTSCCATSTGGWVIGFKTGQISEFDSNFSLMLSYHAVGDARAHSTEVTHVHQNADSDSSSCYLISISEDGVCNLWGKRGQHLYQFTSKAGLTTIESSQFFAFLGDKNSKLYTISTSSYQTSTYQLPSPVRSLYPLGEGYGCLATLQNGKVAVLSSTHVVETFNMERKFVRVVPLAIEEGTGLISYLAVDEEGKLVLCVLNSIIGEIGDQASHVAYNTFNLVTIWNGKLAVFDRDNLVVASLQSMPDVELPRTGIAEMLMGQM
ncbi:hypothetical protein TVAG_032670 [Trichomonas vaginalis G3]|uniref:Uncharacterized protein n=1 Tax=Trichomonas vaginalis (strain ATCC PRA-98 / G3) TaxID=412133 RepID=A2FMI2_TRIV3|nr:WD40 repeat-like family [Trichomonas vaginalis G3]EAX93881.1 hypothetical protein TVAG_032670 [Trichomonas vaginalis G3]KAI5541527.1 WD40 repeat-like family [Trichomonas vaginalis G3]|eukprot:XP_001306811.1 hypothetical protein [Trichomonas vaginalis G3]